MTKSDNIKTLELFTNQPIFENKDNTSPYKCPISFYFVMIDKMSINDIRDSLNYLITKKVSLDAT